MKASGITNAKFEKRLKLMEAECKNHGEAVKNQKLNNGCVDGEGVVRNAR